MKALTTIIQIIYNLSIKNIFHSLFKKQKKYNLPTQSFLLSAEYQNIMNMYVPYNGEYGKFESYNYTRSYINRHHAYAHVLGVFRWRGMQEHLNTILPIVTNPDNLIIDIGGAGCPLGFNSIIVDKLSSDITGKKVKYHDLKEIDKQVDVIFASHVFEHIVNIDEVLLQLKNLLKLNGILICFVPSFSNIYWNAGKHQNKKFGGHVWTFGLAETDRKFISNIPFYADIDKKLSEFFEIEKAEYCGDDSIFILAKNKK